MLEILKQFEGIIGAVIGVFVGWFLKYLDKTGKVTLEFSKQELRYIGNDHGAVAEYLELTDNVKTGFFRFDLEIYNLSNDFKIIKDLQIALKSKSDDILKELYDLDAGKFAHGKMNYEILEFLNIQPKSIIKKRCEIWLDEYDIEEIKKHNIKKIIVSGRRLYGINKKLDQEIFSIP